MDLGARGYIVDYLYLPGLFAADLKDVYLTVFASALIVEALSNPRISVRWLGWREEARELPRLVVEFTRFAVGEIRQAASFRCHLPDAWRSTQTGVDINFRRNR